MKDLTQGSIPKHLISMALPMMVGMLIQTLYFLVDLYFVGKLGATALAGLSLAGNMMFLIFALTQILNVGTSALIAQLVGSKNKEDANSIFNQSMMIATLMGLLVCILGYFAAEHYLRLISKDEKTIQDALSYLYWFIPCMALQFPMLSLSAALRGTGIVKPTMVIQTISVIINIILSPILIEGWGIGVKMGIAGAGFASSISVVCAVVILTLYFNRYTYYLDIKFNLWTPSFQQISRILKIGLPSGGEFFILFCYMGLMYWLIKGFGPDAQAAFGLVSRIMQCLFLPAMALAFAAPAIAGQNFGAKNYPRVIETFKWTAVLTSTLMAILTVISLFEAEIFLEPFAESDNVLLIAVTFLQIISWNFVPSGLVFTCSGLFQSLGNTIPALLSTLSRLLLFIFPALWLSKQPDFALEQLWYLSMSTVCIQALISLLLLKKEFTKRLKDIEKVTHPSVQSNSD